MVNDLEALAKSGPELIARARYGLRDGYPTSSMGGGGGKGVSDPVGQLVVADKGNDPIRQSAKEMKAALERARRDLSCAVNAMKAAQPISQDKTIPTRESQASVCVNPYCGELALWKDRTTPKAGRCPACYEYRRRTGLERVPVKAAS